MSAAAASCKLLKGCGSSDQKLCPNTATDAAPFSCVSTPVKDASMTVAANNNICLKVKPQGDLKLTGNVGKLSVQGTAPASAAAKVKTSLAIDKLNVAATNNCGLNSPFLLSGYNNITINNTVLPVGIKTNLNVNFVTQSLVDNSKFDLVTLKAVGKPFRLVFLRMTINTDEVAVTKPPLTTRWESDINDISSCWFVSMTFTGKAPVFNKNKFKKDASFPVNFHKAVTVLTPTKGKLFVFDPTKLKLKIFGTSQKICDALGYTDKKDCGIEGGEDPMTPGGGTGGAGGVGGTGLSTGAIVGIVIGAVVGAALVLAIILAVVFHKRKHSKAPPKHQH